ncbi:hypothetical protein D4Q52_19790 [Rhodopseudomonas palustris]|uniref:Uncharacterized protein n=1 Tax=Rhodopseudomonas palustris TaxID=1076 RepID=A0A418V175_RHOPL|nr:hypothetical protein D4Q52_19790 [Rhodopseudomonas palustris]
MRHARLSGGAMPYFQKDDFFFHPCAGCGSAARLFRRSPVPSSGELRCYECPKCFRVDTYEVHQDQDLPWFLTQTKAGGLEGPDA